MPELIDGDVWYELPESSVCVHITDEGLIVDVWRAGELAGTCGWTADELADMVTIPDAPDADDPTVHDEERFYRIMFRADEYRNVEIKAHSMAEAREKFDTFTEWGATEFLGNENETIITIEETDD